MLTAALLALSLTQAAPDPTRCLAVSGLIGYTSQQQIAVTELLIEMGAEDDETTPEDIAEMRGDLAEAQRQFEVTEAVGRRYAGAPEPDRALLDDLMNNVSIADLQAELTRCAA
jgi:hypothetical protein